MRRPDETHIFGSLDWQKAQRWKRLRPSGIVKRRRVYSSKAHDAAMEADLVLQAELEARQEAAFRLACDMIKFKNHPTFEMILACYKASHPRATLKKAS